MTSVRHSSFSTTDALRAYLCDLREEISDDENLIGLEKKQTREKKQESSCSASKLKCYQEKWMCMTVTKNGTSFCLLFSQKKRDMQKQATLLLGVLQVDKNQFFT